MTQLTGSPALPSEIRRTLRAMLWRAKVLAIVRGLAVLVAAMLGAILLAVAADRFLMGYIERYVILYEWPIRLGVTLTILVGVVATTVVTVVVPLLRNYSDASVARAIEAAHPELEERLSSTVELLSSEDPFIVRGSDTLIHMLTEQARSRASGLRLRGILRWERAARYWSVTLLVALLVGGIAYRRPDQLLLSLKRLVIANLQRVGQADLVVEGQADRIVPEGEPVRIEARAQGRVPDRVWLLVRSEDDRLRTLTMAAGQAGDGSFACTIPRAYGTWRYQVRSRDSHTAWHEVRAVPRPRVVGIEARVSPPDYVGGRQRTIDPLADSIKVLRHSRVMITVQANKPLSDCVLEWDDGTASPLRIAEDGELHYAGEWVALTDRSFRVLLVDRYRLDNIAPRRYRIRVVHDRPPSVSIRQPGRRVTLQAKDRLPVQFRARDDHAVAKAELLLRIGDADPLVREIPLPERGRKRFEKTVTIDLGKHDLTHTRLVGYRIRVFDTLPPSLDNGPQIAVTPEYEIAIDQGAQTFKMQMLKNVRKRFKAALEEIQKRLEAAKKQATSLQEASKKAVLLGEEAKAALDKTSEELRETAGLAYETAELTAYTDYRKLGEILAEEVTRQHIEPAQRSLAEALLTGDESTKRTELIGRAGFEIDRALVRLAKLMEQFDDAAAYQETAQALADAAERQADLADRIAKLSGPMEALDGPEGMPSSFPSLSADAQEQAIQEARRPSTRAAATLPTEADSAGSVRDALTSLTKEQQELLEATQELVSLHPELTQPVLEAQQERSKSLLEQLAALRKRQEELIALAKEQHTRDALSAQRTQLAKRQRSLAEEVRQWNQKNADALKALGLDPPLPEEMIAAADKIVAERIGEAHDQQKAVSDSLRHLAQEATAASRKLSKDVPDPKPVQSKAQEASGIAKRIGVLSTEQKRLARQTAQAEERKRSHQDSTARAERALAREIAELAEDQAKLNERAKETLDRAASSKAAGERAVRSDVLKQMHHASERLQKGRVDGAVGLQDEAARGLELAGTVAEDAVQAAKKAQQAHAACLKKWQTDEAKRQASLKAYAAETERRAKAVEAWRAAEARRKAALAKWMADHSPKTKDETKKANTSQPSSRTATTRPTTSRPSGPAVAKATSKPTAPPKALRTATPRPKFSPLAKPSEKPAPRPESKEALWNEQDLKRVEGIAKAADTLAKEQARLARRARAVAKRREQLETAESDRQAQTAKDAASLRKAQHDLHRDTAQLMAQASRVDPSIQKRIGEHPPHVPMQQASASLRREAFAQAKKPQQTAVEQLDALQRALEAEEKRATAQAATVREEAKQVLSKAQRAETLGKQAQSLVSQQEAIEKDSRRLARRVKPLGPPLTDEIVGDVLKQQRELAAEAAKLSDELAKPQLARGLEMPAQPDPRAQMAAIAASEAAKELDQLFRARQKDPSGGTAAARRGKTAQAKTARQLGRLVEKLQEPPLEDPARWEQQAVESYLRVQQAERAAVLMERQERLARELDSALAGRPMEAVAVEEKVLRRRVDEFAQMVDFLSDQIELMESNVPDLKPKVLATAQQARDLLSKTAGEAMDTAARRLTEDKAGQALPAMEQAEQAVSKASRLLGTLQAQVARAAKKAPRAVGPSQEELSQQLTDSMMDQYDALQRMLQAQQASDDGTITDPAEAAHRAMMEKLSVQAARAAAGANAARMQASAREFLEAAWQAAGEESFDPDQALLVPGVPTGQGNWRIIVPDSTILDLEMMGLTQSDWAVLPGTLREEVIQAAQDKAPAAYREVIRRYFKVVSQQAGGGLDRPLLDDTIQVDEAGAKGIPPSAPKRKK